MRSRKVFKVYATLNAHERQAFHLYLISPYFGASPRLSEFRTLIETQLIQNPGTDLCPEDIWDSLLEITNDYRPNGFDKLCAELLSALNDFLAMQTFRSHPATVASHQIKAYVDFQLDEWMPSTFDYLIEKLGNDLERDAEGIYAHMKMLENYGVYLFRQPRMPKGDTLIDIDGKLNLHFISKKLELASLVDVYNTSFNSELKLPYLEIVKEESEKILAQFPLLIRLRVLAWLLTSTRKNQYYWELKALLSYAYREIAMDEAQPMFHILLNHCTYRINAGDIEFEAEADTMQVSMIENEMFLIDGKLPPEHLKNIIQLRLLLGKNKWVAEFLDKWENNLSNDHGGCAVIYNRAVCAFYDNSFGECVKKMDLVLRDFKDDVFYGADARIYQLMSLYELARLENDELEDLETRIHALRMYIVRENRIGETLKERYLNLIKLFRKLVSIANGVSQEKKAQKFLQELAALKQVSGRAWFQKQASVFLES